MDAGAVILKGHFCVRTPEDSCSAHDTSTERTPALHGQFRAIFWCPFKTGLTVIVTIVTVTNGLHTDNGPHCKILWKTHNASLWMHYRVIGSNISSTLHVHFRIRKLLYELFGDNLLTWINHCTTTPQATPGGIKRQGYC